MSWAHGCLYKSLDYEDMYPQDTYGEALKSELSGLMCYSGEVSHTRTA